MKTWTVLSFLCSFAITPISCSAQEMGDRRQWTYSQGSQPNEIAVRGTDGKNKNCKLNGEVSRAILSFDRTVLIVSENGYLKVTDLQNCDENIKILIKFIPRRTGTLVDFNSLTKTYISLIFVAVQPLSYVAYIGKLGLDKNLVTLPGTFGINKKIRKVQQEAFPYSDDFAYRPKISPNGRYATPDGDVDCSPQSYPGVWDIEKNKKVIFSQTSASVAECEALFDE